MSNFIEIKNAEKDVTEYINVDHIIRLSPINIKPSKIGKLTAVVLTDGIIRTEETPAQIIEKTITS